MIRPVATAIALLMLASAYGTTVLAGASYDVEWFDGAQAAPAARDAVEQLLSEPWPDPIDVQSEAPREDRAPTTLGSCSDYLDLADRRLRPVHGGTTRVILQARALTCQAARLTLAAQPAAISHLRTLAFDADLPDHLPWQVAMILSGSEAQQIAAERPDASWREALFTPLTGFSSCGEHCGRYDDESATQTVQLVARGDFDGDGIEDVLLSAYDTAKGGSHQSSRMFVLTRRTPDGEIELIRELDY